MQQELNQQSEKLKELNRSRAEIEQLKREKDSLKEAIEAELQKQLNQHLAEEKEKIRKQEQERNEMALRELQKQLEDQKRLTEEMKRKQEQGSMQDAGRGAGAGHRRVALEQLSARHHRRGKERGTRRRLSANGAYP